jgi:hypothetical protein
MSNEDVGCSSFITILILLCSISAAEAENAPIPDAPSSLLPANETLRFTTATNSYVKRPPAAAHLCVVDRQFLELSAISTAAIFADSYSTTWIGNNYRANGPGPCTVEGGEPRLYGIHPTVARSYAVGAGMSAGAIAVSYLARKHLPSRVKWMWPAALIYETGISVHGFSTNLARC